MSRILLKRITRRDSEKELDFEELDSVAADKKDNKIREEYVTWKVKYHFKLPRTKIGKFFR